MGSFVKDGNKHIKNDLMSKLSQYEISFKKIGANVYSTHIDNANFLHHGDREGYSKATPM